MRHPLAALRLRLRRIGKKPKPVRVDRWSDFAGVLKSPVLTAEFHALVRSIRGGEGVPEAHYRAWIDRDRDALLENHGIMHLHLGGKSSDVLIFLIQYSGLVVLLETVYGPGLTFGIRKPLFS